MSKSQTGKTRATPRPQSRRERAWRHTSDNKQRRIQAQIDECFGALSRLRSSNTANAVEHSSRLHDHIDLLTKRLDHWKDSRSPTR